MPFRFIKNKRTGAFFLLRNTTNLKIRRIPSSNNPAKPVEMISTFRAIDVQTFNQIGHVSKLVASLCVFVKYRLLPKFTKLF